MARGRLEEAEQVVFEITGKHVDLSEAAKNVQTKVPVMEVLPGMFRRQYIKRTLVLLAIVVWIVMEKTMFGYELKATGFNKNAARYAGINEKRSIILSMIIAGALAGFGAGLYYLSNAAQWIPGDSTALPSEGFDGISVALLANSHPIGCIFSAIFISYLKLGGIAMQSQGYATEATDIVTAVIIYLAAFSLLLRIKLSSVFNGKKKEVA